MNKILLTLVLVAAALRPALGAQLFGDPIPESALSISDNTTADVSTAAHGFAPKAPNDSTKFLNGTGAWAVPAGTTAGANPSASAGLTAVNGSAATFLRSDGAPAISQSIAPTWTGAHVFSASSGVPVTITPGANTTALTVNGGSVTGSGATTLIDLSGTLNTSGSPSFLRAYVTNTASGVNTSLIDLGINTSTRRWNLLPNGDVNIYPVFTDTSNYEKLTLRYTGSTFYIRPESAGTGVGRNLNIQGGSGALLGLGGNNGNQWTIDGNGVLAALSDTPVIKLGTSSDVVIGRDAAATAKLGVDAASAIAQTLKAHNATGTDHNGADLTLAGGQGTGTGTRGNLKGKVATIGTTGSSANAYATSFFLGGVLKVDTTAVGNVGGGTDDLSTYSITAGQLGVNGDSINFDCAGSFAATANAKTLNGVFGATTFTTTGSLVLNNLPWRCHGRIIRTGAATQRIFGEMTVGGTLLSAVNTTIAFNTTAAETLSGAVTFKFTGSDDGITPADNAVVENAEHLMWFPNGN